MSFRDAFLPVLKRKLATAALATPLFSFLLGFLMSNPFGERAAHWQDYLLEVMQITPIYMLYSFPVILVYGSLTSALSDFLAATLAVYAGKRLEPLYAVVFHLGFGLILWKISLWAAFLYFLVDRVIMASNKPMTARKVLLCFLVLIGSWLLFMSFIWTRG